MVIVIAVGFLCVAFSINMVYADKSVGNRPLQATGTIIGLSTNGSGSRGSGGNKLAFAPEIRFVTSNNQTITFTNPIYSTRFKQHIGDDITVHYASDHPEEAKVVMPIDESVFYFLPVGLLFFFAGLKGLYDAKYKLKMF